MINEFSIGDSLTGTPPWIEVFNAGDQPIKLSEYYLTTDTTGEPTKLPLIELPPGESALMFLGGGAGSAGTENSVSLEISDSTEYLYLGELGRESGDVLTNQFFPKAKESWGRHPDGTSSTYYFTGNLLSPGKNNPSPGPWAKVATRTTFSPRDSSPNACVVFNDSIWVLGGYRHENGEWFSKSDVWKSGDAKNWEIVNDSPPYYPYCAFVAFEDRMWAFGESSYASTNGKDWTAVVTNIPLWYGMRIAKLNGSLIAVKDKTILKSANGFDWQLVTNEAPWDARAWPGLVVLNGRLFFLGGGINYLTGLDYYYTDVWSSSDGISWELINPDAPYQKAYWSSFRTFEGRIWVMGGWNFFELDNGYVGNNNEVWASQDGLTWEKVETAGIWEPRHAVLSFVFKNSLYVSSGYGTNGIETLYNGVWKFNRAEQIIYAENLTKSYGDAPFEFASSSNLPLQIEIQDSSVAMLENGFIRIEGAGQTIIKLSNDGNALVKPATKEINLEVTKASLVLSASSYQMSFGDNLPVFELEATGFVYDDNMESLSSIPYAITNASAVSPIGDYPITIQATPDRNYDYVIEEGTLSIIESGIKSIAYPNPVVDYLNIIPSIQSTTTRVAIFDRLGKETKLYITDGLNNEFTVDVRDLAPGIYYYLIADDSYSFSGKFLKE